LSEHPFQAPRSGPVADLAGRVVILTGGAGLLGRQHVAALRRAGASVVVADRDEVGAARAAAEGDGPPALPVRVDLTDPVAVRAMVALAARTYGRIDALVNNAAQDPKFEPGHEGRHGDSFEDFPLEAWEQGLAANLTSAFLCTQAVGPHLRAAGRGSVVNVASIYGLVGPDQRLYRDDQSAGPSRFKPVVYSATKSALIGFTRYLAAYWAGTGIRANTLTLGGVENGHDAGFVRRYSERTPLGRMARPDEYSQALLFLLSDASSYMTGANLVLDGGWTAW
jgi:NAD(P)-dependent dehydrogenase (short-subunit alcohol dehydrogenase family)